LTYYQPARSEEDYRNDLLKRSEKFWFDGSVSKMVAALVQMKEVSPEERKELKRMIDDLDN
jgi:predicted transcriptional regulator